MSDIQPKSITCPRCGMTSHSIHDVFHRYCGNCHMFHEDIDEQISPLVDKIMRRFKLELARREMRERTKQR